MNQFTLAGFVQCRDQGLGSSGSFFLVLFRNLGEKFFLQSFETAGRGAVTQIIRTVFADILKSWLCVCHEGIILNVHGTDSSIENQVPAVRIILLYFYLLESWKIESRETVSRILYSQREVIHSSNISAIEIIPSLKGCDVPETIGRAARFPISSCIGLGLPCPFDCSFGGGLLPHLFTLTSRVRRFIFCGTGREPVLKQAPPAFVGNPALWCPDFPLHPHKAGQRMTVSRKWSERKYISFQNQKFSRPCL